MMYSPVCEHAMRILGKAWKWFDDCLQSRLGWILAGVHATWFFAAIHAMGPPSRAAAAFRDSFEGADFTIFAGRWFHFHYEPLVVKSLFAADLPAMLFNGLAAFIASPLVRLAHLGTSEHSYIDAGEFLITGTLQWLAIGRRLEVRLHRRKPLRKPD
jgi:hypothetical protein